MADYEEKCAGECTFDYNNEDKQKGVCKIKAEFIVDDHVRQFTEECISSKDKEKINLSKEDNKDNNAVEEPPSKRAKHDDKKEQQKLRGQNKSRPGPYKHDKLLNFCPQLMDAVASDVPEKCTNERCIFKHDRVEFLQAKPEDIGEECYLYSLSGKCPRGIACRMGSKHLTAEGFNVVDQVKFANYTAGTRNHLSKDLQYKLRKHNYDFTKAEKMIKANGPAKNKPNGEQTVGACSDEDLVKLRDCEKKKIDWTNKILLSPLTTVGNLPFRRICKEYGADVTCGEMALAPKLLKGAHEEWALVKRHECEDIFGVQLCGNNPGVLARCAQLMDEDIDVDFIDLNLGCPIDLIYRQGGGSGMLNRLNVLESVVKSVSQVLTIPLTVKTRMGVYMDKPIAHDLMPKFRDWGASMITVHGRSREQRYSKLADWQYIERCAKAADPIPVFGNGDILSYSDYKRVREECPSVQGCTIGRGALIKPWIFKEIKEKVLLDVSSSERFDILKKYVNYGMEHWGSDSRGVETTRRFLLEWISFLHRYIPVGVLERPPQRINERPPYYRGRDDMETLMASSNCADWIKISEMLLGKVPDGFQFLPKHKANSWK